MSDPVLEKLESEQQHLRELIETHGVRIDEARVVLAGVEDERFKAWEQVEKSIPKKGAGQLDEAKPEKLAEATKTDRRWEVASKALFGWEAARAHAKTKLRLLEDPAELQRRRDVRETVQQLKERKRQEKESKMSEQQTEETTENEIEEKETKLKLVKNAKKETARDQGVPEVYLKPENGAFKSGYDSKLKTDLVHAVLGLEQSPAPTHKFDKKQAQKLIDARGWQGFVDKKREAIAAKKGKAPQTAA